MHHNPDLLGLLTFIIGGHSTWLTWNKHVPLVLMKGHVAHRCILFIHSFLDNSGG